MGIGEKTVERVAALIEAGWPGGARAAAPSLPGAAAALVTLALARLHRGRDVVVVAPGPDEIESLFSDIRTFMPAGGREPLLLYAPEAVEDPERDGMRLAVSRALFRRPEGEDEGRVFLAVASALLAPLPDPDAVDAAGVLLHTADETKSFEATWRAFVDVGYERAPEVVRKGQMAVRGGLVDIWPPTSPLPVRIDFFGDSVDTIRQFDPASQRSAERLSEIWIPPCAMRALPSATPLSKISEGSVILHLDHDRTASMVLRPGDEAPRRGSRCATALRRGSPRWNFSRAIPRRKAFRRSH